MGRRVVFLRQLSSGLLLVTGMYAEQGLSFASTYALSFSGPFCVNGVPLRRVNQAYVVATKTKVDISTLDVPARLDDNYFHRSRPKTKAGSSGIFADSKQVSV